MKKILIISILVLLFFSCQGPVKRNPNPKILKIQNETENYEENYRIYTLDSCEYVVVGHGKNRWGTHKGDCKNPIHQK
jgi:hypothetical protein